MLDVSPCWMTTVVLTWPLQSRISAAVIVFVSVVAAKRRAIGSFPFKSTERTPPSVGDLSYNQGSFVVRDGLHNGGALTVNFVDDQISVSSR